MADFLDVADTADPKLSSQSWVISLSIVWGLAPLRWAVAMRR